MKAKMNKFEYMEPSAILEDLRLIFENCERYNVPDATEYLAGQRLCRYFVKRVKELALTTVLTDEATNSTPKQNGTGQGKAYLKDSTKGGAKGSTKGSARGSARGSVKGVAKGSAKGGAKGGAKGSAKGSARGGARSSSRSHPKVNGGAPPKLGGRHRSVRRT